MALSNNQILYADDLLALIQGGRVFSVLDNTVGTIGGSVGTTDRRWIIATQLPQWSTIESLGFYAKFAMGNLDIELWKNVAGTLTRVQTTTRTNMTAPGAYTHVLGWQTDGGEYYLGFKSSSSTVGTLLTDGGSVPLWYTTDKASTTLAMTGLTSGTWLYYLKVVATSAYVRPGRSAGILTVGKSGCDYSTIQAAVDNANDTAANPVTILVHPGTYARFSMVGWPNLTGDWSQNRLRYISIIGVNRREVFVRDDTGNYNTPPAEIRTRGLIKGITFLATHDVPDTIPGDVVGRAYGVHMDFGSQDVVFDDCSLYSYQAAGAGIGLHTDEVIEFRNCQLRTYASTDFGGRVDQGGLFCHSQTGVATNQRIILHNSRIYSANGNRALWLSMVGDAGSTMSVEAINTLAYSYAAGATHVVKETGIDVTPDSYGNSAVVLNPLAIV